MIQKFKECNSRRELHSAYARLISTLKSFGNEHKKDLKRIKKDFEIRNAQL